jgi:hypothetical protein
MKILWPTLVFLLSFMSGQTTPPEPSPAELFRVVRTRLMAEMNRQGRFTCVQNINRQVYSPSSSKSQSCSAVLANRAKRKHDLPLLSSERLRLEVAVADNREIHSWPGAAEFSEDEIRKLTNSGPFGGGDFATFIPGIFGGSATVKFESYRTVDGRTLFAYAFDVPESASHYQIATAGGGLITAYGGSFSLDPQTNDLVQLTVRTAELPEATTACQTISDIQYERIDIHGNGVLIPRETGLRVIYRSGREATGVTSYSGCQEYSGKSTLRFDLTEASSADLLSPRPAVVSPSGNVFAGGLSFDCRIVTPIDSETTFAGSPIEAILRSPLRDKSKVVLASRGAHIRGHLVRFVDHKNPVRYFEIGVRLESIEVNGAKLPLYATLADPAPRPTSPPDELQDDPLSREADFVVAPPPNVGLFFFSGVHLRVRQLDSAWITVSVDKGKQN